MNRLRLAGVLFMVSLSLIGSLPLAYASGEAVPYSRNPVADDDAVVTAGRARFTVLTPSLLRLEWSRSRNFEDRASFMVVNRQLPVSSYRAATRRGWLTIETDSLILRYRVRGGAFSSENLFIERKGEGLPVTWHPGMENTGNLGGTVRTLDMVSGATPLDPGVLSRDGWTLIDDSRTLLLHGEPPWPVPRPDPDAIDWYFFGHGRDYSSALHDYTAISGSIPLPPRWSFGAWWSRYWDYSAEELEQLVQEFDEYDVPLDVLVIDMDWHQEGWTGYTWNRELFPDPDAFLAWVHEQGLHTTLNLHPHDGVRPHEEAFPAMARALGLDPDSIDHIPFDIADPDYMRAYFELLHHPLERQGVDFWWIDWQQGEESSIPGLDPLFWLNHLHWKDMENRQWESGRRPLIFSRWGGLGSHRYQIGFSGDTYNNWESLAFQPYFTSTAGNVAYPFWSHDIGGHQPGPVDGELYARWIQFGLLNPYLRTHATKNPGAERRIWAFGDEVFHVAREAFRLRYSLIPYIYSTARQVHDTSLPMLRPLYYHHPDLEEAYRHPGEYYFGESLLAAPVTRPRDPASRTAASSIYLPPGSWHHWYTGERYVGGGILHTMTPLDQIPLFARAGAIIPLTPPARRIGTHAPEQITFRVFPGELGAFSLYEDDGISAAYLRGESARTPVTMNRHASGVDVEIGATEGSYDGIPEVREYSVELLDVGPPNRVLINGEPLPRVSERANATGAAWWYDPQLLAAVVLLPEQEVRAARALTFTLPDQTGYLLPGLRGRLDLVAQLVTLYANHAPASAVDLLLRREKLADSLSTTAEALQLAHEVERGWSDLAAAFSTAQVEVELAREAFLRMHGLSVDWQVAADETGVTAKVEITLLEELQGVSASVTFSTPDGWEVADEEITGRRELPSLTPVRFARSWRGGQTAAPARVVAEVLLATNAGEFSLPVETVLFPSIGLWSVIGPFDNPGRHDLSYPFGPESTLAQEVYHEGKEGRAITWQVVERDATSDSGLLDEFVVDLQELFGGYTEDAVAYALVLVDSPEERSAMLALGSDDGAKVWLNGEVVHENEVGRPYTSQSDKVQVKLLQGENSLLLKISQGNGGWSFGAHLLDEKGDVLTDLLYRVK